MKPKAATNSNSWWCETCHSNEMTFAEMEKHVAEVHHTAIKGLKGKKTMMLHLDCPDSFTSQYAWDFDPIPLKMTQSITCRRTGMDAQIWAGEQRP